MHELFEAFGVDWRLLIAQAVNFGIVLVALTYFLYKPVTRVLEERRAVIARGVDEARRASEKLSRADEEAQSRIQTADGEAEGIVRSAREAAGSERTKLLRDAEARAAQIAEDAQARAEETAAKSRRESEQDIARLAVLAAEKVLAEKHG